jgi:hypothetical protein
VNPISVSGNAMISKDVLTRKDAARKNRIKWKKTL